jgi:outer membrane protein OmpA-like peptidoglycan-associated protein
MFRKVLFACLLAMACLVTVWAQPDKKNFKSVYSVKTTDETFTYQDYYFNFPNINKEFSYSDPALLKKILEAERKSDFNRLLPLLEEYTSNYGIQNFYKETIWLWKLAELYQKKGQTAKSRSLVRLVLKHSRAVELGKVRRYYDSSGRFTERKYVPLNYYWELVEYRRAIDTLFPPQKVLTRMYDGVNSKSPDYAPSLNLNDDTLIFTSKRNKNKNSGRTNEDIYLSQAYEGYFEEENPLASLNTQYNEGSAVLSKDGKTILFCRCESPDGYGNCDIYQAQWDSERSKWANVKNLGTNINGKSWESQPALSVSEDTLYFSSDRLGGFGGADIYFTVKDKRGNWGPAQNLGPYINTRFSEVSPFIHHTYNVLYFSSNSPLINFGGFDIYKTYIKKGLWIEPKNIGPLVNGPGDEYYFTIDTKSAKLYYARSEVPSPPSMDSVFEMFPFQALWYFGGPAQYYKYNLDLYSFPLPMEAQPTATTRFSGNLTDSLGNPFEGIVSILDLDKGIEVAPQALREDGSFDFDLIRNNNYLLVISGDEFFRIQEKFFLKGDTVVNKKAKSIRNAKVSFSSIEFQEGSTEILPSMYRDLSQIINFMTDNPRFKLRINGHTDNKGKKEDNMYLSSARAESIKKFLVEEGKIRTKRVEAMGYGPTKPIVIPEITEADRKINRRVEFEIVPPTD